MYQSVYSLYLYRNDEERENVMNRLKRRQFGAQKQQRQQQRQYGRQNYQRRQYHKRRDDCEINITIDDEPDSEPEPVKPVERVPFNGERDIKKCYF